jgi:hypothetical protein
MRAAQRLALARRLQTLQRILAHHMQQAEARFARFLAPLDEVVVNQRRQPI